jgi:glycosyltransferase involved in cell wall biosynthesis
VVQLYAVRGALATLVFNQSEYERLSGANPNTYRVKSWFDSEIFRPESVKSSNNSKRFHLLWVGRFETQKNPFIALEVAASLRVQGIDVLLNMVGSGSLLASMQDFVEQNQLQETVVFTLAADRHKVASFMAGSDCLILTSYSEGSPVVLAESGAMGLPCVVLSNADPDQFIVDSENGYRLESSDPEKIASAVLETKKLKREQAISLAKPRSKELTIPFVNEIIREA